MTATSVNREEAEIAVVGAGPCGSTAAAVLAELGHDVLLLDKDTFPREKPCGDGVLQPAVAMAEQLGLDDLIGAKPEMEACRIVLAHRRQTLSRFTGGAQCPLPRCIPRQEFDAALLGAARGRGARFMRARVEGLEGNGDGPHRLTAVADGQRIDVSARFVIGADGATSRVRRLTADSGPPDAYAIRQYFTTRRALDPIFEIYVPLEIDGNVLAGYGWVFPVDAHTANVGVGAFRNVHHRMPPLRRLLAVFVEELRAKAALQYGDMEPAGEPIGSPVGMRSPLIATDRPGVVLGGDAAGTIHPLTGEGIAYAMRGGEALARLVHSHSRRNGHGPPRLGGGIWRSFPQLGTDTSALYRFWVAEMNKRTSDSSGSGTELLTSLKRMIGASAYETGAAGTPAWEALQAEDTRLADALEAANRAQLDRFSDPMPFVTEVLHDSIRSRLGPMYAGVVLTLAMEGGRELPDGALEGATAVEAVGVLPEILTMLVDRARSKSLRVNNALAVLTGDFAATRALAAAAQLGPEAVKLLARTCQRGCEGGMRDAKARFAADRTIADWLQAATETNGAGTVLATQLGAMLSTEREAEELEGFGYELGIAIRMAEEIADFAYVGEQPERGGARLRRGIYPLPLLYAIEAVPSLPRLLAQHTAEGGIAAEIFALAVESGALEKASAACAERAERAAELAASLAGGAPVLEALARVPTDYVAQQLRAPDLAGVPGARSA